MTRQPQHGFTLIEVLAALLLAVLVASGAAGLIASAARASTTAPLAADRQQRARAAADQLTALLARAGEGPRGTGLNRASLLLPALYPQRRGVVSPDPETSAFSDRVTVVAADDTGARAELLAPMGTRRAPLILDQAACAAGRPSCGFSEGSVVLIADARAGGEWFTAAGVTGPTLGHVPGDLAQAYAATTGTQLVSIDVRSLVFDARRRQLRLATPGTDVPMLDGVTAFEVRWFGDARTPGGPVPPAGESNCILDEAGLPRLAERAVAGPWSELSPAELSDGPWCGQSPWRYDADLYRVRLVRLRLAFDPAPGAAGAGGGAAVVDTFVGPRSLGGTR